MPLEEKFHTNLKALICGYGPLKTIHFVSYSCKFPWLWTLYLSIGRKKVCCPGTPNMWVFWFKSDWPLKILKRKPDKSYNVDFDNNFLAFRLTKYWDESLKDIGTRGSKTESITCITCWSPLRNWKEKGWI